MCPSPYPVPIPPLGAYCIHVPNGATIWDCSYPNHHYTRRNYLLPCNRQPITSSWSWTYELGCSFLESPLCPYPYPNATTSWTYTRTWIHSQFHGFIAPCVRMNPQTLRGLLQSLDPLVWPSVLYTRFGHTLVHDEFVRKMLMTRVFPSDWSP